MITVRLFGSVGLADADGRELDVLLRQPKRVALLAYLASAQPRGFHRRDTLMGLFWPESPQDQARHALRQALHVLRQELGDGVVVTRGDGDVAVDLATVAVDVLSFERALAQRDYATALAVYRGDFLHGYFVAEALEFERWVDEERTRLRELAAAAAWALAHEHIAAHRPVDAERTAQRALSLVPTDESEVRRFLGALAGAGERAAAVRLYEKFAQRIREDYGIEPAAETLECIDAIRSTDGREGAGAPDAAPDSRETARAPGTMQHAQAKRRIPAPALAALAGGAVVAVLVLSGGGPQLYRDRVVVAPFENRSSDSTHDEVGQWALDWISNGLKSEGVLEVVPAGVSTRVSATLRESSAPYRDLARATRSGTVVIGWYYVHGDSIRVHAEVLDARSGDLLYSLQPVSGLVESALQPIEAVRSGIIGVLARHVDPDWPGDPTLAPPPPSAQVYRETMAGLRSHVRQAYGEAIEHYRRALALDSLNFQALKGLGSSLHNLRRFAERDSIAAIMDRHRQRFAPLQRAHLDRELGWIHGDLDLEYRGAQQMARLDPLGQRFDVANTALRANHPGQAVQILTRREISSDLARQWLGTWIVHTEALHVLGDHEEELRVARRARAAHPDQDWSYLTEVRALIALGRIDEVRRALDALPASGLRSNAYPAPQSVWRRGAAELRVHGYDDVANAYLARAIAFYRGRAARDTSRGWREALASSLYSAGRYAEAYELFAALHDEVPDSIRPFGNLGAAAARLGKRDEAKLISDSIARWNLRYVQARRAYFQARIDAILGDHARAVRLLRDAIHGGLGYGVYLHTSELAVILRDYPPFQELMRPKR
jgi:serine/threonine-protein kinase